MIYDFTLPIRLVTLNVLMRMHWRTRTKHLREIAWYVLAAAKPPAKPFAKAHIVIERESTQEPDPDGLRSCAKGLLDVLQPVSKIHPCGLGFIENDSSDCISLDVRHIKGKGATTRVMIREVE